MKYSKKIHNQKKASAIRGDHVEKRNKIFATDQAIKPGDHGAAKEEKLHNLVIGRNRHFHVGIDGLKDEHDTKQADIARHHHHTKGQYEDKIIYRMIGLFELIKM